MCAIHNIQFSNYLSVTDDNINPAHADGSAFTADKTDNSLASRSVSVYSSSYSCWNTEEHQLTLFSHSVTNTVEIQYLSHHFTALLSRNCGPHPNWIRISQDLCKETCGIPLTYFYPSFTFFYTPLYRFLICELRRSKQKKGLVIYSYKNNFFFITLSKKYIVVHTCWFCLKRVRASWSMYFLSVSVSLVTPLCACQVRAMRNTRVYSDNTVLRVEAVIGAPKLV